MILSIILGLLLGVYAAYMINIFNENKHSKYVVYFRFFIVVSISILGPVAVYVLRLFEGEGPDGDTSFIVMVVFCISLLGSLLVLLKINSKKLVKVKKER